MTTEVPHRPKPGMSETGWAIIGSLVISIVIATLLVGSPFRALGLAYLDYSHTPAAGGPPASTTDAPAPLKKPQIL